MSSALRVLQRAIRAEWPVRLARPLVGKFNPFLSEFRINPYPQYHALRRTDPIYFSPSLRGWILTRYRDIAAVLQDPRFSANRRQATLFQRLNLLGALEPQFADAVTSSLLMVDPPDHTRLRRLVSQAFTPRRIEQLRARTEQVVEDLLDAVSARGEMDLIRELAVPLPLIVIAEMLGVSAEDRDRFKEWSDALTALLDPMQAEGGLEPAEHAYFELVAYMRRVVEARRREPRDDLISVLAAAEDAGDRLSEAELYSLCMLLLGAGNETTTNLLGNAVLALMRHPQERERLAAEPSLTRSAVEEFLRYDSPVQLTDRVVTEDSDIGGHRVRKGQLIGLILGAANRDPERFPDPDRLDIARTDNAHLAFGSGNHFCLGAQLARLEAEVAIRALVRRFPHFDGDHFPTQWKRSIVLRGVTSLRLVW